MPNHQLNKEAQDVGQLLRDTRSDTHGARSNINSIMQQSDHRRAARSDNAQALRSVHTDTFPRLLSEFGASVAVTTYQAGKLILLRNESGVVNTHFRSFLQPMGLALGPDRLAVGTSHEVWDFRNVPAVAQKLDPPNKHDACFLPRRMHVTGNIQIHEMAYIGKSLWIVNTAFSCLCNLDEDHSFSPSWRPSFVSGYEPSDRCHLNGLAVHDGCVRWVTALGETDSKEGWREGRKNGGILIDVQSNDIICRNLSMPHSPRYYADRLWLLESGTGSFGYVDLKTGKYESVVKLNGFTRGLDFLGHYAFVGLSQVRETATFSGIEITENLTESDRTCGVWVVDIRTGQVEAFVKFEDAVQEVFAVAVLSNMRFPDLINDQDEYIATSYVLPDDALKDVPVQFQTNGPSKT